MNREALRALILRSLRGQGFRVRNGQVLPPVDISKSNLRSLHEQAVRHRLEKAKPRLERIEPELLEYIAKGTDVIPEKISPKLVEVRRDSLDELLFRHACLHWSIPVSSGYGRRLRFLVMDSFNNKLMGLIGLGDPVFSLAARDAWIGWDSSSRRRRLQHVMDAFVLGAVPPYSYLLGGKLVAMLATSNTVRKAFSRKYGECHSLIRRAEFDGRLAMITTTSALGRSSIYNRLKFEDRMLYQSVGFTRGSGEFHFSNGLYASIAAYAERYCVPTAKKRRWGNGFRNRREVVKKCLTKVGLSTEMVYHGIQREIFVIPLAANVRQFLRGEHTRLSWYDDSATDLFEYFKERWLLPRSRTDDRYREWDRRSWRLWASA